MYVCGRGKKKVELENKRCGRGIHRDCTARDNDQEEEGKRKRGHVVIFCICAKAGQGRDAVC